MNIKKIIRESINKVLLEDAMGSDEEFDAFMRWAMTDGNDYGFGDAASEYVNGGDEAKLYIIALQYSKITGIDREVVFSMAKEAADGIYGFMNDSFDDPVELDNMELN